ncbi:hypothetical protein NA56DRAFT_713280 [Hyaloscypha hepaticicola]|uniref:Uncharacterized protein n=1 Tax=Hyaloscypha hepaticicola TaxID=2082293 RepID=A0A2J6PE30_9HELO|nr:hypothetical protein NA56DRAFT_713280 [Hyaloscypha hepaticicola]
MRLTSALDANNDPQFAETTCSTATTRFQSMDYEVTRGRTREAAGPFVGRNTSHLMSQSSEISASPIIMSDSKIANVFMLGVGNEMHQQGFGDVDPVNLAGLLAVNMFVPRMCANGLLWLGRTQFTGPLAGPKAAYITSHSQVEKNGEQCGDGRRFKSVSLQ